LVVGSVVGCTDVVPRATSVEVLEVP